MTNDEKNLLMQPLYKIAEHNGLQDVTLVSFKKRSKLLDQLKEKDEAAWMIINNYLETAIKLDRITNDKEKQEKNNAQWNSEIGTTEKEKEIADERLKDFCKENKIAF